MDFLLVSDLHIDENNFDIKEFDREENKDRILLNLGDTFTYTPFAAKHIVGMMNKLSHYFKYVVFCLGNHDFYGQTIHKMYEDVYKELKLRDNPKLIFLDGKTIFTVPNANIEIFGDVLWSWMPPQSKEQNIEDYMKILSSIDGGHLKFSETNTINKNSLDSIKNFLQNGNGKTKIVATHFPPKYYDQGFPISWLTYYFHNDNTTDEWFDESWMDNVIWCHGHTHTRYTKKYMNSYIYSNARGYSLKPKYFPMLITID